MKKNIFISVVLVLVSLMLLAGCISKIDTDDFNGVGVEDGDEEIYIDDEQDKLEEIDSEDLDKIADAELKGDSETSQLPKKVIKEGELVNFPNLKAVDPDGDPITYFFSSPLNEKGEWLTEKGDAGEYVITVTASDGVNSVSQDVLIIVKGENRPPVLQVDKEIYAVEGDLIKIEPRYSDPDPDDVLVLSFGDPFDEAGLWQSEVGDAGNYNVVVRVSDGKLEDSKVVKLIVESVNKAPVIEIEDVIIVEETELVELLPVVKDPEGDDFTVSYSGWMTSSTKQTDFGDAGEYKVTITAEDVHGKKSSKTVTVIVEKKNRPPVFLPGSFE